ncbi:MAG: hypothetical protein A2085_11595 [Gemmatimonadetes bacterium GWC2_71_10]|nr:MAG: hypothetical protein A2085_11595 [Gemmatimonadetes bacterium GWC2_71_10]
MTWRPGRKSPHSSSTPKAELRREESGANAAVVAVAVTARSCDIHAAPSRSSGRASSSTSTAYVPRAA